jgi:hypothetical protein
VNHCRKDRGLSLRGQADWLKTAGRSMLKNGIYRETITDAFILLKYVLKDRLKFSIFAFISLGTKLSG